MTQTADVCRDGGGEGDALVGQITACRQLVGVRTVGRSVQRLDFLQYGGGEGFVVAGHHGDFVHAVLRIPVAGRAVCSGSWGRISFPVRKHGTLVLAIIGQYAIELASGVEAMIQSFGFRDIQMHGVAFGTPGNEILSRILAVGKV